jgi:ribosomal protein S18 acetylase RimI-like enzyme
MIVECGQKVELHTLCIAPEHQGRGQGRRPVVKY